MVDGNSMTEKEFCTWLKGFVEIHQFTPTSTEWGVICEKLKSINNRQINPAMADKIWTNFAPYMGNPPTPTPAPLKWGDGGVMNCNKPEC